MPTCSSCRTPVNELEHCPRCGAIPPARHAPAPEAVRLAMLKTGGRFRRPPAPRRTPRRGLRAG